MSARWIDEWMDERVLSWRYMGWVEGWEQPRTHPELRWTLGLWMPHLHLCPLPTKLPMERAKFRISNQNTILVTYSRSWRILWGRWDGGKWPLEETPWVSWRLLPQLPPGMKAPQPDPWGNVLAQSLEAKGGVLGWGSNPGDHRNSSSWIHSSATEAQLAAKVS